MTRLCLDKHVLSEDEKKTQEYIVSSHSFYILSSLNAPFFFFDRYDKLAFRYVSYVAIPLLAAYTIYSLIYESHKGWYSFVISTLTSFVYMFGFVSLYMRILDILRFFFLFLGAISPPVNYQLQT